MQFHDNLLAFASTTPMGWGNSGTFEVFILSTLKVLHCGVKFVIKTPVKSPSPSSLADNNEEQQLGKKVQVGNDQEKAQSEKDSHSKNRDGKKTN